MDDHIEEQLGVLQLVLDVLHFQLAEFQQRLCSLPLAVIVSATRIVNSIRNLDVLGITQIVVPWQHFFAVANKPGAVLDTLEL